MEQLERLQVLIRAFNWHTPSWDLFIIIFWIVASVIYAFVSGPGRILTVLISVYMSKLLVIEAPFLTAQLARKLPTQSVYLQQLGVFAVIFAVLFVFLGRYAFHSSAESRRLRSLGFGLVFALLQVGLLINIVLSFLPQASKDSLAPLIRFLFIDQPASFVWLILPVVFLVLLGKFVSERREI
jgi:hypothetical protein